MSKPAKPDRYVVDRQGTPDPPTSEYYVLDVVHDWVAREALARLGNRYRQRGQEVRAKECFQVLDDTLDAHQAHWDKINPKQKKKSGKRENVHP